MTILIIIIGIIVVWVILAQIIWKRRISDRRAKEIFRKNGVELFTGTVDADGFEIHYVRTGTDNLPTLFFVHGTPGSWKSYEKFLQDKNLLSKYRLIAVDRPGFGYSQFGDARNLEGQSKIISHLINTFSNGQPVYLIGASFGGPVVTRLAIDNPGKFSGILLLAPALDPAAEVYYFWRPLFFKTGLKYFVPGIWKANNEELWYLIKDLKIMAPLLPIIDCPVYVLHGDKDKSVPVSNAFYAQKLMVNAKPLYLSIIPGGSHSVADENYMMVKEILMKLE